MRGEQGVRRACATECGRDVVRWHLCEQCGHVLAGMCLGKRRWRTQQRAQAVVKAVRAGGQAAYRCRVCSKFHVGRQSAETEAHVGRAAEVITALRAAGNGWLIGWIVEQWAELDHADRERWKQNRRTGAWA